MHAFTDMKSMNRYKHRNEREYLFFSNPIRNAASANAARRLPVPASFPVTAYSLTNACEQESQNHSKVNF